MIWQKLLHYEIVGKLGEGGMGVVSKARDTHLDRFVAIKVLPPKKVADASRKARFVQEAKASSALNHPNIVTIYDISSDGGCDFIAIEYIAGQTLSQLIPRKGMRMNDALKIAVQIADALARAHGAGIVHRDLKPANLMADEHGLVKVLDFGLAELAEKGPLEEEATLTTGVRTEEGAIVGTVSYTSPEQAEGRKVDARSDIFSFGSVLYEMVTGQRAFQRDTKMSTLGAVMHEEPRSASGIAEGVPPELERLINRCLRKEADRRIQTMADLRVALEELRDESQAGRLAAAVYFVQSARLQAPVISWVIKPLTSYPGWEISPSWSPDGQELLYSRLEPSGQTSIVRVNLTTGAQAQVTFPPPGADDLSASWSFDGQQIVFTRERDIWITPARCGEPRLLVEGRYRNRSPTWSADSRRIVFVTDRGGPDALREIEVDSGRLRQLTTGPADWYPASARDGRLAYCQFSHQLDFYTVQVETGAG